MCSEVQVQVQADSPKSLNHDIIPE